MLDDLGRLFDPRTQNLVDGLVKSLQDLESYLADWMELRVERAFRESGLDVDFRYVGMAHHPQLDGVTYDAGDYWVEVQSLRERFDAHLVYAILPPSGCCGAAAYKVMPASTDRRKPEDPYIVNQWETVDGAAVVNGLPVTLTHEIGHNLGLVHDPRTRAQFDQGDVVWEAGQGFQGGSCVVGAECNPRDAGATTIMVVPHVPGVAAGKHFSTSSMVYVGGPDNHVGLASGGVEGKKYPLGEKGVHESVDVLRWSIPRLAMSRQLQPPEPVDSETDLILHGGRFTASILVDSGDSFLRPARPVDVDLPGESSGLFYFFDPENAEVLFKVLNGCEVNGHWWVFAAAATDLYFELTVVDRQRTTSERYVSVGRPPPITDVAAFPCSN